MQKHHCKALILAILLFLSVLPPALGFTSFENNTAAYLNSYRSACGLNALALNSKLSASAGAHSVYITANFFDMAAFSPSYHYETPGKPSFYGVDLSDRTSRAGYSGEYLSEVIMMYWNTGYENTFFRDAINGWMDSIYHRFGILNPNLDEIGAGESYVDKKYAITLDFGTTGYRKEKRQVAYPPENSLSVPLVFEGNEIPEPLPAADYPVGYPVTLTFWGQDFKLQEASLRNPSGQKLDSFVLDPGSSELMQGSVAVVSKQALEEASIYTATVAGALDGKPYSKTWSFVTSNHHTDFFSDPYRFAGFSRYSTSAKISSAGWQSSRYIVIANGLNYPDALAGIPLASAYGAPLLLCAGTSVTQAVLDEINRLKASEAIILGGEAAVGSSVVSAITGQTGVARTTRLGGANRYETAALIALKLRDKTGSIPDKKAVVVSGENFPDALTASAYAGYKKYPVLLVRKDSLPVETAGVINILGLDKSLLVGGTGVISDSVAASLPSAARISGANRYETSARMAEFGKSSGLSFNETLFASGASFPDALSGGAYAARNGNILLLTYPASLDNPSSPGEDAKTSVNKHAAEINEFNLLGGLAAVSESVKYELFELVR